MLVSMLTLRPAAGRRDDLVAWYRTSGVLEESGALSSQVLVGDDAPDTLVVTALWADADGYRAWQDSPRRAEFGVQMASFFDRAGVVSTQQFDVAHAWPDIPAPGSAG
jgi:heme-degrading monooxygenase HmoA